MKKRVSLAEKRGRVLGSKQAGIKGPPATSYTPYDDRKGAGYGTIDPKFDISYQKGSVYPYVEPPSNVDSEDGPFDDDPESIDKFVRMVNMGVYRNDPSRRQDRASFVSNQRIRIPESKIGMRRGDSLHGTISPIPKSTLYGTFDGPAVGGSSANVAFNPGTFKGTGTQYGTSRAPLYLGSIEDDPGEDITAYTLEDILYPDDKAVVRAKRSAKSQQDKSKK